MAYDPKDWDRWDQMSHAEQKAFNRARQDDWDRSIVTYHEIYHDMRRKHYPVTIWGSLLYYYHLYFDRSSARWNPRWDSDLVNDAARTTFFDPPPAPPSAQEIGRSVAENLGYGGNIDRLEQVRREELRKKAGW